jgi:periplasmic protein TonB
MFVSAPIPAPAGWAPARAPRSHDARRALLRNALLLSSVLHLSAGLSLSYLLRERPGDALVTLAMRPRVMLVPPGAADPMPVEITRPAPSGAPSKAGVPVPVLETVGSLLARTLSDLVPVAGPVAASEGPGAAAPGGTGASALPPPAETAPLPLGTVVDEAPQVIFRIKPVYPPFALDAGLEGRVLLHVLVGTDGSVREIRVVEGSQIFTESAASAVGRWRFRPARVGVRPVPIWVAIPVRFRL